MLQLFLCGLCMGTADLMPGISGSTVAMLFGFYREWIEAISTWNFRRFLLPLVGGIATAILSFSHLIHFLIADPVASQLLYSFFFGLALASSALCYPKGEGKWFQLSLGVVFGYLLSTAGFAFSGEPSAMWLMFCGACAVSALLMPGISGSYVLMMLGVYPVVLGAVVDVLQFKWEAFQVLGSLLVGIVLGALAFSRVVSWLLRCYECGTMSVLCGVILGALHMLVPEVWGGYHLLLAFAGFSVALLPSKKWTVWT